MLCKLNNIGVIAGFLYALNTILGKIATGGDDPETMTFYMLLFSSITMGIIYYTNINCINEYHYSNKTKRSY